MVKAVANAMQAVDETDVTDWGLTVGQIVDVAGFVHTGGVLMVVFAGDVGFMAIPAFLLTPLVEVPA